MTTQVQSQPNTQIITLRKPCCASVRECGVHYIAVIGIRNFKAKVLRYIEAVRCYREGEKHAKVTLAKDILIVYHYKSNRANVYLTVYKPRELDTEIAKLLAVQALGYADYPEEKLHVEVLDFDKLIQQPQPQPQTTQQSQQ